MYTVVTTLYKVVTRLSPNVQACHGNMRTPKIGDPLVKIGIPWDPHFPGEILP